MADNNDNINFNKVVIDLTISRNREIILPVIKRIIYRNDISQCRWADKILDNFLKSKPNLEKKDKKLYQEIKLLQTECQWIALPLIEEEKVVSLYGQSLNVAWEIPKKYHYFVDEGQDKYFYQRDIIREKFRDRNALTTVLETRDALKNKVMDALKNNAEIMTKVRVVYNQKSLKPHLYNWFNLYFSIVGTGKINKLKQAEFFSQNKNWQKLSEEEKAKLRLIFDFYEELKESSTTIRGFENPVYFRNQKGIGYMEAGEIKYYPKKEVTGFDEFLQKYKDILLKAGIVDESFYHDHNKNKQTVKKNKIKKDKIMHNDVPPYQPTDEPRGVVHDIFNELDAKEIEDHKANGLVKPVTNYEQKLVAALKQKFSLEFEDEILEKRFDNIIISYLHDIRDAIELKEILMRPLAEGGLAYSAKLVDDIITEIKDRLNLKVKEEAGVVAEPATTASAAEEQEKEPLLKFSEAQNIINQAKQAARKVKTTRSDKPLVSSARRKTPSPSPHSIASSTPIPQVTRLKPHKPVVKDISSPADKIKLVGPYEELRSITLAKFRRLADNPVEAAEKIKEKIDLLEEQSLADKARGIAAFKNSPLNKIYLKIGNTSIDQGRSVQEVITDMQSQGEKVLTKEEFDAIADLNKKLRF